ncbi:endonuclease-reverse transcriptase [Apostichopus japonicus]|uniref:Endonuclease-reverse transcriptase n=1 Tax=Stichopus japonicus TaxID=307972 RepID=A0A2G8KG10_STIJA|nr:endonuclease-reverse transcriptase [Apostichopus japonicus]
MIKLKKWRNKSTLDKNLARWLPNEMNQKKNTSKLGSLQHQLTGATKPQTTNLPKRKLFNQCVLPAMTYGCETWTLTKMMEKKLQTTQRSMARMMLAVSKREKTNIWIRHKTKVKDVILTAKECKCRWAGHIDRLNDDRWTSMATEWQPPYGRRRPCKPKVS